MIVISIALRRDVIVPQAYLRSIHIKSTVKCWPMYPLRHFLLRGGVASRSLFLLAFTVLFARALLPGVVMLGFGAPQASFGLVMCSGHGPMFAHDQAMTDMGDMGGMDMSSAPMPGMDMSSAMKMDDHPSMLGHSSAMGDMGDLCPFSAAFIVACFGIALACLLFTLAAIARVWRVVLARTVFLPSLYFRPLSRAPPVLI
ncbi:hypothetical protein [Paraburkholderia caribensis]|uniref:hypothetical protein n=1 Tax=Paraburkholderia caribensis TaxID=75105 RepID=UPI00078D3FDC|nr:hypothetical protein [Paraburkholderia caribensis]AMV48241.1 hypothetical protein ATN79_47115 [Paraburkholderia caribensis]